MNIRSSCSQKAMPIKSSVVRCEALGLLSVTPSKRTSRGVGLGPLDFALIADKVGFLLLASVAAVLPFNALGRTPRLIRLPLRLSDV